jgi:hypothetical protein
LAFAGAWLAGVAHLALMLERSVRPASVPRLLAGFSLSAVTVAQCCPNSTRRADVRLSRRRTTGRPCGTSSSIVKPMTTACTTLSRRNSFRYPTGRRSPLMDRCPNSRSRVAELPQHPGARRVRGESVPESSEARLQSHGRTRNRRYWRGKLDLELTQARPGGTPAAGGGRVVYADSDLWFLFPKGRKGTNRGISHWLRLKRRKKT